MEGKLVNNTSKCLKALQNKSLLSYNAHTQRYRYHQLIKEFFTFTSSESIWEGNEQLNNTFYLHYEAYYGKTFLHYSDGANKCYNFQDTERSNIDFLTSNSHKINPDVSESLMNTMGNLAFGLSELVLDTLHLCKSAHKSPQFLERLKLIERLIHKRRLLINVIKALQNIPPLHPVAQLLQRLNANIEDLYSAILRGDIHYTVSLGIEIDQQGLISFDFDFMLISIQRGLSVSLELYVNLVIQLSKLEATYNLKAMSNLLAKWAVKYSKFSKIGIVDLDGPLIAFQCRAATMPCAPF